jgi:hypothetical protein
VRPAFVPSRGGSRAVVYALGDCADGTARARTVAGLIPDPPALDLLLYLGDVYDNGRREEYERNYAPLLGRLDAVTAPCPGNHEWGRRAEGYLPYWTRARGVAPPPWYAFRLAGWLLVSLNSEEPCAPGSPQHAWLLGELARSDEPVLAFWHRPRFNAGNHGDAPDVAPLWDAVAGRAPLVLSGHDHNLQRFHPVDGTVQFVAGAGGHTSYVLDRSWRRRLPRWARRGRLLQRTFRDPSLAFGHDEEDGVLRLELRPGAVDFAFVGVSGRVLDAGTLAAPARVARAA